MNDNKLLILAAVGIGAFLFTRGAQAANSNGYASQQNLPVNATRPTVGGYFPGAQVDPTVQKVGAVVSLIGAFKNLFTGGMGSPTSEAGDASSNAGEAAAQQYFMDNRDSFAANPPTLYQQDTGWVGSGFDSQ